MQKRRGFLQGRASVGDGEHLVGAKFKEVKINKRKVVLRLYKTPKRNKHQWSMRAVSSQAKQNCTQHARYPVQAIWFQRVRRLVVWQKGGKNLATALCLALFRSAFCVRNSQCLHLPKSIEMRVASFWLAPLPRCSELGPFPVRRVLLWKSHLVLISSTSSLSSLYRFSPVLKDAIVWSKELASSCGF